uniref:Leucine-rich repeat domain, L domain-like protein n=1 Tax=Angiostrongylus cantonensis TaxID=6313 RepID=A0A0K0DJA4_ANGCA
MPKDKRRDEPNTELDHVDRNLTSLNGIPRLFEMTYLTRLTLSHNKLTSIPPNIADLENLQILTLWNNQIDELPSSISSLSKLRILNVGMNRLNVLPRGFGSFKSLEILDLTYNNLNERSLPGNFFFIGEFSTLIVLVNIVHFRKEVPYNTHLVIVSIMGPKLTKLSSSQSSKI